jgi:flagellar hook protein FlgE
MGMLTSMYSGVSGLNVHGRALSSVADNVANLSTYGYKATRTNFGDIMVHSLTVGGAVVEQVGAGARVTSIQSVMSQGSFETTDIPTDLAINGKGFFVVRKPDTNAGATTNTGPSYYSRAGAFSMDKQGYMVNTQGMRLQGYNVDGNDNLVQVAEDLRITTLQADAIPTSKVELSVNLNAEDTNTHGAAQAISPSDSSSYNYQTSVRTYDSLGVSHDLTLYFQRLTGVPSNVPVGTSSAWKASIFENQGGAMVPMPATPPANTFYTCFDTDGHLTGTTDYFGLPALGDMFTSVGALNQAASAMSTRAGETLTYTGGSAPETYRSTLTLTFTGVGSAADSIIIGNTDTISLPAGVYATTADTATGFADAINNDLLGNRNYYAVANGSTVTLYPTSAQAGAGLSMTTSLTYVAAQGDTLNGVVNTINNGRLATETAYFTANPANGETIDIDGATWTARAAGPLGANEFLIGVDTAATLANLVATLGDPTVTSNGSTLILTAGIVGQGANATGRVTAGSAGIIQSDTHMNNGLDGTAVGAGATDVAASVFTNANGTVSLRLTRATPGSASTLAINTATNTLGASAGFTTSSWVQNQYAADAEPTPTPEAQGQHLLPFSFPGATPNQTITFDFAPSSASASTQSAGTSETFYLYQDGTTRGSLQSLDIDSTGMVTGQFTNGTMRTLGAVVLANFANPDGMKREGENLWSSTLQAGTPIVNRPGEGGLGSVESGALEQSNVDLAAEFVKMINYQRAFQANSKTISTTDQMLQELIQLKR